MGRKLNLVEKKAVKNLQVSNSIYRKDIKGLTEGLVRLDAELTTLKELAQNQLGEELNITDQKIVQIESELKSIAGKIAYKEGRIAEKETEIENYYNKAAIEEEVVLESYDPNITGRSTEHADRKAKEAEAKAEHLAKKEADKAAKKAAREAKKAAAAQPTTTEF